MRGVSLRLSASALVGKGHRPVAQEAIPAAGEIDHAAVAAALPALTELAEAAVRDGAVPGLALASSPRSHYAFSNIGFTIGGLGAAAAVDMTWEDASEALPASSTSWSMAIRRRTGSPAGIPSMPESVRP